MSYSEGWWSCSSEGESNLSVREGCGCVRNPCAASSSFSSFIRFAASAFFPNISVLS